MRWRSYASQMNDRGCGPSAHHLGGFQAVIGYGAAGLTAPPRMVDDGHILVRLHLRGSHHDDNHRQSVAFEELER